MACILEVAVAVMIGTFRRLNTGMRDACATVRSFAITRVIEVSITEPLEEEEDDDGESPPSSLMSASSSAARPVERCALVCMSECGCLTRRLPLGGGSKCIGP